MKRRSRFSLLRVIILFLALAILGTVVISSRGLLPFPQAAPPTEPMPTQAPTFRPPPTEETEIPPAVATQIPFAPGKETPADQWANSVLDVVLPLLQEGSPSADDLAWWRSEGASQALTWEENKVTVGGQPFLNDTSYEIEFSVSDPQHPSRLEPIASAARSDGALLLTIGKQASQQSEQRWVLSTGSPLMALQALAVQASARNLVLWVTYAQEAGAVIQMVILEARSIEEPAVTPTPDGSATATQIANPTSPPPATATRAPEPYLGELVAAKIDPAISDAIELSSLTTLMFLERHPWAGVLASTEHGIQIRGRATAVGEATELSFYLLQDTQQTSGGVSRLFGAQYTVDATTRFSEEQILFQGHRMEEILYWVVIHAAERGGQLVVAYDDFGQRQAITIIGFKPFQRANP